MGTLQVRPCSAETRHPCLAKPHSDGPIHTTLSTAFILSSVVQNQKKKHGCKCLNQIFFDFDVTLALALAFALSPLSEKNDAGSNRWWGVLHGSGVCENIDVFKKRYMDVLAASPEPCNTPHHLLRLYQHHFHERSLIYLTTVQPAYQSKLKYRQHRHA